MSIGKSQALAIASDVLNGSGSIGDLSPRETVSELILLAAEFIEDAQANLNESNSNASGSLSASLESGPPTTTGTVVKIDISMLPYGLFVNSGVKGTKSGQSNAGYAFKKDIPSADFIKSIMAWQSKARSSVTNSSRSKSISRNEIKNHSISALSKSFAIARSIMQHGLKPTGFLDKAVRTTTAKVEDRLGKALEIDIITAIKR